MYHFFNKWWLKGFVKLLHCFLTFEEQLNSFVYNHIQTKNRKLWKTFRVFFSKVWVVLKSFINPTKALLRRAVQFLKQIVKNLENQNLILYVFVFNGKERPEVLTARENYPLLRTPEPKSTKNEFEVQRCHKTTLVWQAKNSFKITSWNKEFSICITFSTNDDWKGLWNFCTASYLLKNSWNSFVYNHIQAKNRKLWKNFRVFFKGLGGP